MKMQLDEVWFVAVLVIGAVLIGVDLLFRLFS